MGGNIRQVAVAPTSAWDRGRSEAPLAGYGGDAQFHPGAEGEGDFAIARIRGPARATFGTTSPTKGVSPSYGGPPARTSTSRSAQGAGRKLGRKPHRRRCRREAATPLRPAQCGNHPMTPAVAAAGGTAAGWADPPPPAAAGFRRHALARPHVERLSGGPGAAGGRLCGRRDARRLRAHIR